MSKRETTGIVLLVLVLIALVYDLIRIMVDGNYDATISQWVYTTSHDFLIIPLLFGIVIGHFFWPIHTGETK